MWRTSCRQGKHSRAQPGGGDSHRGVCQYYARAKKSDVELNLISDGRNAQNPEYNSEIRRIEVRYAVAFKFV